MNLKQSYIVNNLSVELSFTGFIPDTHKEKIDSQTKNILTGFNTWSIILHNWINFIRNDPNLMCPEIVRNNNFLSLGLIFTDDAYIAKLNEQWRQKNVPTDVLSFPALDGKSDLSFNGHLELGDIIISVETAIKQSILNEHSLSKELKWLVSHGLLHLLGWDHPNKLMLDQMLTFQERLISLSINPNANKLLEY